MVSKVVTIIRRSPVALLMRRHKKHHDAELYQVLADCMEISEICLRDIKEYEVLNRLIKKLPILDGKNRQFVEKASDIYQRTCRFMFHGAEHYANVNRYAHCLREAAEQGIKAKKLIDELSNGGVNKFYLRRPSQRQIRLVATKCLRLDRQVKHYKGDTITLKLKRDMEGKYTVLEFDDGTDMQPRAGAAPRRGKARRHRAS